MDDRKSLSISFLIISDQYATFFSQNGCRRPFWMTENHFRSHFSPFQINTQLLFLFTKWLPAAILDDRKSHLIAFLAISDQCTTLIFFTKSLPAAILDDRKSLLIAFLAISDQYSGGGGGDGAATKNLISQKFSNFGDIIISVYTKCIYYP